MDDKCIGGWTVETLHRHLLTILDERRAHIEERFRQIERNTNNAERLLEQYKLATNEYRETFLPKSEHDVLHKELIGRIQILDEKVNHRLDFIDRERNLLRDDVTIIKSRAGYLSVIVIVSTIGAIVAVAEILFRIMTH